MRITPRHRELLRWLWTEGPLSRWELHQRTGVNPNAVGQSAGQLLKAGVLRERDASRLGRGRPRVPLEIDPERRHVLGLALVPGGVQAARVNLLGEPMEDLIHELAEPASMVAAAESILRQCRDRRTLAIGVSIPGLVDLEQRTVLVSSALPGLRGSSLQGLWDAAGPTPLTLENDMHAWAAQWLLTRQAEESADVLLVRLLDGQLGAAVLINGRPNRGCAVGGNELGHMRFFVETAPCYCGHKGCLERIWSSAFLSHSDGGAADLDERLARFDSSDAPVARMLDYLSAGIANAVNFIRPSRLVLASPFMRHEAFCATLLTAIRGRLLAALDQRVRVEFWNRPATERGSAAAWPALAHLYREGWLPAISGTKKTANFPVAGDANVGYGKSRKRFDSAAHLAVNKNTF